VLVFVFTFALWFSEGYLRYDRSETQYRMSLTMHPASARPILRTVVRRETEQNEIASSRHLEALAQVEEPDKVLPNYKLAYEANPRNASLIMNYGCALYQDGQYDEARERFRESGVNPPRNVLPRYLEAAALAAGMSPEDDLSDVIALLTRTNTSEDPVLFPEPLWHESMPTRGQRYLEQRREIAGRIVAPLNALTAMLCQRARESIEKGELRDWDNWLNAVVVMGDRLMGNASADSPATIPQLTAALGIQYNALSVRAAISAANGGVVADDLNDRLLRLNDALKGLHDFDAHYHELLNAHGYRLFLPVELLLETVFAFLVFYSFGWFLHYLGSGGKSARAVPHLLLGKLSAAAGLTMLLAVLMALMAAHNTMAQAHWEEYIPMVWRSILVVMLILGLVYPPLLAKRTGMYDRIKEAAEDETVQHPRKSVSRLHYLGIYGCLMRRYMGLLCGGVLITICVWLLIYRMAYDVYPFQMQLITSSVGMETDILIEEIRQYLATP
jgi:tetratricopeptide (TPR) repeat protein